MSSYGDMKIFGGVVTLLHPPEGGHFFKKVNNFQKVAICVCAKNNIKND